MSSNETCPVNTSCGTGGWNGPKPGDPETASVVLRVYPVFGGIRITWTYPLLNPSAVAHTLLYRAGSNNFEHATEISVVAGSSYFDDIQIDGRYYYWIKIVSVNGTVSELIGPSSSVVRQRKDDLIDDIWEQIDKGALATELRRDIEKITQTSDELKKEISDRLNAETALGDSLNNLQQSSDNAYALLEQKITAVVDGQDALVERSDILAAANKNNAAQISAIDTIILDEGSGLVKQVNDMRVATGDAAAAIQNETEARTAADSALAGQINTVQSSLGNQIASVQSSTSTNINNITGRINAMYTMRLSTNGLIGGYGLSNDGVTVEAGFDVDRFWVGRSNADKIRPFMIENGIVYINDARIRNATIDTLHVINGAMSQVEVLHGTAATIGITLTTPANQVWKVSMIAMIEQGAEFSDPNYDVLVQNPRTLPDVAVTMNGAVGYLKAAVVKQSVFPGENGGAGNPTRYTTTYRYGGTQMMATHTVYPGSNYYHLNGPAGFTKALIVIVNKR